MPSFFSGMLASLKATVFATPRNDTVSSSSSDSEEETPPISSPSRGPPGNQPVTMVSQETRVRTSQAPGNAANTTESSLTVPTDATPKAQAENFGSSLVKKDSPSDGGDRRELCKEVQVPRTRGMDDPQFPTSPEVSAAGEGADSSTVKGQAVSLSLENIQDDKKTSVTGPHEVISENPSACKGQMSTPAPVSVDMPSDGRPIGNGSYAIDWNNFDESAVQNPFGNRATSSKPRSAVSAKSTIRASSIEVELDKNANEVESKANSIYGLKNSDGNRNVVTAEEQCVQRMQNSWNSSSRQSVQQTAIVPPIVHAAAVTKSTGEERKSTMQSGTTENHQSLEQDSENGQLPVTSVDDTSSKATDHPVDEPTSTNYTEKTDVSRASKCRSPIGVGETQSTGVVSGLGSERKIENEDQAISSQTPSALDASASSVTQDEMDELQSLLLAKEKEFTCRIQEEKDQQEKLEQKLSLMKAEAESAKLNVSEMSVVIEGYDHTLRQIIAEKEKPKQQHHGKVGLIEYNLAVKERNEAVENLQTVENAFSELNRRYETLRYSTAVFKKNEGVLKICSQECQDKLYQWEEKFKKLYAHAEKKLELANEEIEKINKANETDTLALRALVKKQELQIDTLEKDLKQKEKEIQELMAICDELIQKAGESK